MCIHFLPPSVLSFASLVVFSICPLIIMNVHSIIVIIKKLDEMLWYTFICTALNPMLAVPLSFVTNLGQFMVVYKSYEAIHFELSLSDVLPSDQTLGHLSNPLQRLLTPFRISSLPGSQCISSGPQSMKSRPGTKP